MEPDYEQIFTKEFLEDPEKMILESFLNKIKDPTSDNTRFAYYKSGENQVYVLYVFYKEHKDAIESMVRNITHYTHLALTDGNSDFNVEFMKDEFDASPLIGAIYHLKGKHVCFNPETSKFYIK